MILATCRATIGEVGNEQHGLVNIGKAGRTRWLGKRPTVRGSVMNPNDHHTVVVKDVLQSDVNHQCHLGVNLHLVRKLVLKKLVQTNSSYVLEINNKTKQRLVGEEQVLFTRTLSMQSIGKEITQWLVV